MSLSSPNESNLPSPGREFRIPLCFLPNSSIEVMTPGSSGLTEWQLELLGMVPDVPEFAYFLVDDTTKKIITLHEKDECRVFWISKNGQSLCECIRTNKALTIPLLQGQPVPLDHEVYKRRCS